MFASVVYNRMKSWCPRFSAADVIGGLKAQGKFMKVEIHREGCFHNRS